MSFIWAILPIANAIYITLVPMPAPPPVEVGKTDLKTVFSSKIFWIFLAMMFASGASEMAIQQWASTFAESALRVDKSVGDLVGVCGYAVMMGSVRLLYGKFSEKIPKKLILFLCGILTLSCFMAVALAKNPIIGFLGCIFCGFAVGIFWPGTFTLATSKMPGCTTSMFALLSLAGDVGCTTGPTVTGFVSEAFGGDLRMGILVASIFPVIMISALALLGLPGEKTKL
jgi:fucose permease